MKKKFVSSIVFLMLVAGFQARALESAVDKGVMAVENVGKHSAFSENFNFTCKSIDLENPLLLKIKDISMGGNMMAKIDLEDSDNNGFGSSTFYAATTFEDSDFFKKYSYNLVASDGASVGDFVLVQSIPLIGLGEVGKYCGRGLCKPKPQFPKCGRGGCDDEIPIVKPITNYKGILKIHEKEILFTCQ